MADGLVYVPGNYKCPRCRFQLVSKNINMASGTISAKLPGDREECPNCPGVVMEPVTWKSMAEDYAEKSEQIFKNGYDAGRRDEKAQRPHMFE